MTRLLLLATVLIAFATAGSAQPLIEENFDYPVGDLLTAHGWTNHSGTGEFLVVTDNNLTFPGYPSVIGNSTQIVNGGGSREDVNRQLSAPVTDGSVYVPFLVSPSIGDPTPAYFFHGGPTDLGTTFRGRVFIQTTPPTAGAGGGTVQFGISKASSSTVSFAPGTYALGGTYLLVMKYTFLPGVDDDTVDLYVFEAGDDISVEPALPDATNIDAGSDLTDFGTVALRQSGGTAALTVDGIRAATTWDPAVIPVELTAFGATTSGTSVHLNWETASETNNAGFEVQLDRVGDAAGFEALAFVAGNGTTTEAQTYGHTVTDLAPGTYAFRLKQIDFDGAFEYSDEVEATIEVVGTHVLTDAYPNPFNPQATFTFAASQAQTVTAVLYNALGQRVAVLFDGSVEADQTQTVSIDGAGLSSGLYVVRVEGERFSDALRVTLLK